MQLHGFIINFADANLKAVADETVGCPVYNRTSPEDWITRTQDTRFWKIQNVGSGVYDVIISTRIESSVASQLEHSVGLNKSIN